MKRAYLLVGLSAALLPGCSQQIAVGTASAMIVATRPQPLPKAETETQIPGHENWCYRTMGDIQCYTKAQDVQPSRLVNVGPENLFPLTPATYRDEVAGIRQVPATTAPVDLDAKQESEGRTLQNVSFFEFF